MLFVSRLIATTVPDDIAAPTAAAARAVAGIAIAGVLAAVITRPFVAWKPGRIASVSTGIV